MLDLKLLRENLAAAKKGLSAKRATVDLDGLLRLDQQRREISVKLDDLRSQKNQANDEISKLLKEKKDPKSKIAAMKGIAESIDQLEPQIKDIESQIDHAALTIPNLPHASVPVGGADKNKTVRSWGRSYCY